MLSLSQSFRYGYTNIEFNHHIYRFLSNALFSDKSIKKIKSKTKMIIYFLFKCSFFRQHWQAEQLVEQDESMRLLITNTHTVP